MFFLNVWTLNTIFRSEKQSKSNEIEKMLRIELESKIRNELESNLRSDMESKIRHELEHKIRRELEPKIRREMAYKKLITRNNRVSQ